MSAFHKHIFQQQDAACTLKGVLEAIAFLDNEGSHPFRPSGADHRPGDAAHL